MDTTPSPDAVPVELVVGVSTACLVFASFATIAVLWKIGALWCTADCCDIVSCKKRLAKWTGKAKHPSYTPIEDKPGLVVNGQVCPPSHADHPITRRHSSFPVATTEKVPLFTIPQQADRSPAHPPIMPDVLRGGYLQPPAVYQQQLGLHKMLASPMALAMMPVIPPSPQLQTRSLSMTSLNVLDEQQEGLPRSRSSSFSDRRNTRSNLSDSNEAMSAPTSVTPSPARDRRIYLVGEDGHLTPTPVSHASPAVSRQVQDSTPELTPVTRRRSQPAVQVTSPEGMSAPYLGQLNVIVQCKREAGQLSITIAQAVDLAIPSYNQDNTTICTSSVNPYVRGWIMPGRRDGFKTRHVIATQSPLFNQTFLIDMSYEGMFNRSIDLVVLSYDGELRRKFLGQASVVIGKLDPVREQNIWLQLRPPWKEKSEIGELLFSVCYMKTAKRLVFQILRAKGLSRPAHLNKGPTSTYIKVELYCDDVRKAKRKTKLYVGTEDPQWDEHLYFDLSRILPKLPAVSCTVKLMEKQTMQKNSTLGKVTLGWEYGTTELQHWSEVFCNAGTFVEQWHPLTTA